MIDVSLIIVNWNTRDLLAGCAWGRRTVRIDQQDQQPIVAATVGASFALCYTIVD